ncbi:MAG: GAF domain-containing protein [Bacteroidales bacterium]|nr:GAF domain-containing protein [Bacteroidales bacterium]MCF8333750.1 GAF domain-containing protein [Bacteroidales bacterium]
MEANKKEGRYSRIFRQLEDLMQTADYPLSRMATIAAVLHHKMDYFFWTGFYLLVDGELMVHAYQGPVACMHLEKGKGVCWSGVERKQPVVVPDVEQFPGHIACDSRSQSEIVVPVRKQNGEIVGVLDIDSSQKSSFDEVDEKWLEKIVNMIYA